VSQKGQRKLILDNYQADLDKVKGYMKTPANLDLASVEDNTEVYSNSSHFLSIVMALMYLARLTRYDILFVVCFLATRSNKPSMKNYMAACRVLKYLKCSGDYGILFKKNTRMQIKVSCDSSHRMYTDGKGQGGITVSIGSGVVHARSYKIKMTMLSPMETEGYVVCEGGTYVVFMINLLKALGVECKDIASIKQDNLSTIWLQTHDGKFGRNKHIVARDNYSKELIEDGLSTVSHCDTEYLNSDMLTKVLGEIVLKRHMFLSGLVYMGGRVEKEIREIR